VIRIINGIRYSCRDVGCDNLRKAALNRERVKKVYPWWSWYETVVKSWPKNKPFPYWIPLGNLPSVSKHEERELKGFHEVE